MFLNFSHRVQFFFLQAHAKNFNILPPTHLWSRLYHHQRKNERYWKKWYLKLMQIIADNVLRRVWYSLILSEPEKPAVKVGFKSHFELTLNRIFGFESSII